MQYLIVYMLTVSVVTSLLSNEEFVCLDRCFSDMNAIDVAILSVQIYKR